MTYRTGTAVEVRTTNGGTIVGTIVGDFTTSKVGFGGYTLVLDNVAGVPNAAATYLISCDRIDRITIPN